MEKGRISIKLLLLLITVAVAVGIFFAATDRESSVLEDVNAVESSEAVSVPQEPPVISKLPVVLELIEDRAFRLQAKDGGEIIIEAKITYEFEDKDMVSKAFGTDDTEAAINKKIVVIVEEVLKNKEDLVMEMSEGSRKRISLMVQIHGALLKAMKQNGVRVSGVNIRKQ